MIFKTYNELRLVHFSFINRSPSFPLTKTNLCNLSYLILETRGVIESYNEHNLQSLYVKSTLARQLLFHQTNLLSSLNYNSLNQSFSFQYHRYSHRFPPYIDKDLDNKIYKYNK